MMGLSGWPCLLFLIDGAHDKSRFVLMTPKCPPLIKSHLCLNYSSWVGDSSSCPNRKLTPMTACTKLLSFLWMLSEIYILLLVSQMLQRGKWQLSKTWEKNGQRACLEVLNIEPACPGHVLNTHPSFNLCVCVCVLLNSTDLLSGYDRGIISGDL